MIEFLFVIVMVTILLMIFSILMSVYIGNHYLGMVMFFKRKNIRLVDTWGRIHKTAEYPEFLKRHYGCDCPVYPETNTGHVIFDENGQASNKSTSSYIETWERV